MNDKKFCQAELITPGTSGGSRDTDNINRAARTIVWRGIMLIIPFVLGALLVVGLIVFLLFWLLPAIIALLIIGLLLSPVVVAVVSVCQLLRNNSMHK